MNLAIIGYGKMGKAVEKAAQDRNIPVSVRVDPHLSVTLSPETLSAADVCIDFTHPDTVIDNIRRMANYGKNIVVGTTGWYHRLDEVQKIVEDSGIGLMYAPNFSLGVNLFLRLVREAAQLINPFEAYDVSGLEVHHNQKADIPSGTAQVIAETIIREMPRKKAPCYGNEPFNKELLHFPSLRCGSVPGTHTVMFDSPIDTITLTHEARSREGFAAGAVTAAAWLRDKKGLFTIDDLINTLRGQR